jgi:PAS domain S-box-containing protein
VNVEIHRPGRGDLTLSGFVAAACVAVALVCAAYWLSLQQSRAAAWVSHTQAVLATIARTRAALVDIQDGHRGFTISGQEKDLEPYLNGRAAITAETARLRALVGDNPVQQKNLSDLESGLVPRLASAAQLVAARRAGGFQAAKSIVDTGLPNEEMTQLRTVLQNMEAEEERLLRERLADHERRVQWFWVGMSALVAVLFAALAVLYLQVRRRRAAQQALLDSEYRFRLMTSRVLDYAIIMLDLDGRVATWNAGAQRITGYGEEQIVGRDYACFHTPEDIRADKPMRTLQTATSQGHFVAHGWLVRNDASAFWASVVITALRDSHGDLRGFSMIARDLTERKRAEEALQAEMRERMRIEEELQRLNRSLEGLVQERTAKLRSANTDLLDAKLRLRDLSAQLITAQEEERRHIARELHDETGQSLTVIRMHLSDLLRGADGATARVPDCIEVVDAAIAQIRGMALNLRPTMLDDLGLADALQWALEQQAKVAGWSAKLEADEILAELPADIQTACFRIGQEALANAARHAGASEVKLGLRMVGNDLELTVSDDGAGFDLERYRTPEERRKHFGLISMAERAGLVGGNLDIETAPGRGTRIRASFPVLVESSLAE